VQGDYTGRFCYLRNCDTDEEETTGEIIGGKPDYDVANNPKNLTLYLKDPKIDEVHARIFCRKYEDYNRYIIQDLSNHEENKEASGIWIQLPDHETDIFSYDYLDRELTVLNGLYLFKLTKIQNKYVDELRSWMA